MADEEYGDEGYGYFQEEDWLYIEEQVAFADELAETQLPSPGYSGVNAELMLEWYEYDTYEYFGELEYGSDAYWDVQSKEKEQSKPAAVARGMNKRKRASTTTSVHTEKRRRLQAYDDSVGKNVLWREQPKARHIETITDDAPTYALLPDWRERFPEDRDIAWEGHMPEEMKRAAQAHDGAENEDQLLARKALEQEMDDEAGQGEEGTLALDANTLRTILRAKLGDTGMDEEAFMTVINQMLSGGGSSDAAAAQLTSALLGKEGESSEAALGWLADQGVKMEDEEEQDDDAKAEKTVSQDSAVPPPSTRSQRSHKRARKQ